MYRASSSNDIKYRVITLTLIIMTFLFFLTCVVNFNGFYIAFICVCDLLTFSSWAINVYDCSRGRWL